MARDPERKRPNRHPPATPTAPPMPTVCVDFDGVLNTYNGWQGPDVLFKMAQGAREFLQTLKDANFQVVIFTTRDQFRIWHWLKEHEVTELVDEVTSTKPPALFYVDDRAVCHEGDFDDTLERCKTHQAHWADRPSWPELPTEEETEEEEE